MSTCILAVQDSQPLLAQLHLVHGRYTRSGCASRSSLPCTITCSPHLLDA